nr:M16 family metallopeptidase [Acinetobacter seifertii]
MYLDDFDENNINISYDLFELNNGLRVIVVEDHQSPLVNVAVRYCVGASYEPEGRKGFAHLFEHLMFCGTKEHPGSYLQNLLNAGAVEVNGYTTEDETFYFQTVPTSALDYVLFAESSRMGAFSDSLSQSMLDQQIGIVLNEKDEREAVSFGLLETWLKKQLYPSGHSYALPVIGLKEDISKATLQTARDWFEDYYSPANAILTLSGSIDAETAKEKVSHFFGSIPTKKMPVHPPRGYVTLNGEIRSQYYEKIAYPWLHLTWIIPPNQSIDTTILSFSRSLLAGGQSSYLNRILIDEKKLAQSVEVSMDTRLLSGELNVSIAPQKGISLAVLEYETRKLLQQFIVDGLHEQDIDRLKKRRKAENILALESHERKAKMISNGLFIHNDPDYYKVLFHIEQQLNLEQVRSVWQRWLNDKLSVIYLLPRPELDTTAALRQDRLIPEIGANPEIKVPIVIQDKLQQGIDVFFIETQNPEIVYIDIDADFGNLNDPTAHYGLTQLVNVLKEKSSIGNNSAADFEKALQELGAKIKISSTEQFTQIRLITTLENIADSLRLLKAFIFDTQFSAEILDQERQNLLAILEKPYKTKAEYVDYVLPSLLYDKNYPLHKPPLGKATAASIRSISLDDVIAYHQAQYLSKISRIVVTGGTSSLKAELNELFGHLPAYQVKQKELPVVDKRKGDRVYLVSDKVNMQSGILLMTQLPSELDKHDIGLEVLRLALTHAFTSRINLNLREDKSWTYGVQGRGSKIPNALSYGLQVNVEKQYTAQAIQEILKEIQQIYDQNPLTEIEYENIIERLELSLLPFLSSTGQIANYILWVLREKRPFDWLVQQQASLRQQTLVQTQQQISKILKEAIWTWVIHGDLTIFEDEVRQFDIGEVMILPVLQRDEIYPVSK